MLLCRHVRLSVAAILLLGLAAPARGQTILSWTGAGADSNWTTVGNWGGTAYPNNDQPVLGNQYDAIVGPATGGPVLNANISINNFTLTSGTVSGGSNLNVGLVFTWSGGTLGGTGTVTLNGGGAFSGSMSISQPIVNVNGSTVNFTTATTLASNSTGATWDNQNGATFTLTADAGFSTSGGAGTFTNEAGATFQKTGGSGTSTVAWAFNNSGTIFNNTPTATTIAFTGGGTQAGAIIVANLDTVQFSTAATTWTGTAGSAEANGSTTGKLVFSSGTHSFNGTNTLATPVTVSGTTATTTIIDGTGALTISGALTWSGGSMGAATSPGAGTTTLTGGATITASSNVNLNRSVFNASGSTVSMGSATLNIAASSAKAIWDNQSGSTFKFTSNGGLSGATGTFTNEAGASFQKSAGSGTSTVAWGFTNNGAVSVATGTLSFTGANAQKSTITAAAGAVVSFATGTSTWTGTAGSSGAGTVALSSGTILFNGTDTLANVVSLTSATVDGSGTMTIGGLFAWNGGNLGAATSPLAGTTTLNGGGLISNAGVSLNRTVFNASGSTMTVSAALNLTSTSANAIWTNQSGSTFNFTADGSLIVGGGAGTFNNNSGATFEKTGGTTSSVVNWTFTNAGTVLAGAATLSFGSTANLTNYSAGTLTGGTWRVLAGDTLLFGATRLVTTIGAGTTVELNGVGSTFASLENNVTAVAGTLNILGGRAFTPGGPLADTGTITVGQVAGDGSQISGAVLVNNNGVLRGSGTVTGAVTLSTGGTFSINGFNFTVGSLAGTGGTVTNNAVGAGTLTLGTDNSLTNSYGGAIVDGSVGPLTLVKVGTGTQTLTGVSSYSGGTNIQNGMIQVSTDTALGTGSVTSVALGTLNYTGTTTTTRSFTINGGTLSVSAGQTVTFSGGQVSGAYLDGAGTFATDSAKGATVIGSSTTPSVTVVSNSAADRFINFTNGGTFNVGPNVNAASGLTFSSLINQGSGTITIGANSSVNASNVESFGLLNVTPGTVGNKTLLTNVGTAPLSFGSGSRTFIGTVGAVVSRSGLELNGENVIVTGGLFVNNGQVTDNSIAGVSTIIADYGALVKGAGQYDNSPQTRNGGQFQAGNSPGVATVGRFVFGPGGVTSYLFAIDNATGQAGPTPDANGQVSGWGLVKTGQWQRATGATSGDFVWNADSTNKLTVTLDTLVNPTTAGTDVNGLMANFNPNQAYSWPAVEWVGNYSGPTDVASLNAATTFDTHEFANPVAGTFAWSLDPASQALSLTYTPSAVPEPGTVCLTGLAGLGFGWVARRRARSRLATK